MVTENNFNVISFHNINYQLKTMIMKKVISVALVAAFVLTAGGSFAQDKPAKDPKATKKEVKAEKKEVKAEKKEVKAEQKAAPAQASKTRPTPPQMPSMDERAKQSVERLATRIKDLSPEQVKKLTDIHLASFKQAEADKELSKTDMEKFKEAQKTRVTKMREDIKSVLTEAQWKVYTTPPARPTNPPDGAAKKVEVKDAPKVEQK